MHFYISVNCTNMHPLRPICMCRAHAKGGYRREFNIGAVGGGTRLIVPSGADAQIVSDDISPPTEVSA